MRREYQVMVGREERMRFVADFSEASSNIAIVGDEGPQSTPYQVADARHRPSEAASLLNDWCRSQGGEAWGEGEEWTLQYADA